jgi:DNA-binding transcriptional regulator/RsmH inhibitor MraZ
MARFQKGISGNPAGRKKGVGNRTTEEVRTLLQSFFESNWESLQQDFKKLKPYERWNYAEKLLRHFLPAMKTIEMDVDLNRLSDSQVNAIINEILNNSKNENNSGGD